MKINITQEVIDRSKAKVKKWEAGFSGTYCSICVIAEAFKEAGFEYASVDYNLIEADDKKFNHTLKSRRLINRFDEKKGS